MISIENMIKRGAKVAASSNGKAAVAVAEFGSLGLMPIKYAPESIGAWENRAEYQRLFAIAAAKLGYKRDHLVKGGWRRVR